MNPLIRELLLFVTLFTGTLLLLEVVAQLIQAYRESRENRKKPADEAVDEQHDEDIDERHEAVIRILLSEMQKDHKVRAVCVNWEDGKPVLKNVMKDGDSDDKA